MNLNVRLATAALTAEQWHFKATDEIRGRLLTPCLRVAERRHSD